MILDNTFIDDEETPDKVLRLDVSSVTVLLVLSTALDKVLRLDVSSVTVPLVLPTEPDKVLRLDVSSVTEPNK